MAAELLPVVDLRTLSQSDLDALAAASAHALAPRSCPDGDPLAPLKINRAVFNESAGSRRQTFSRLRFAAASSSPTAKPAPTSSATPSSVREDPDRDLLAYHLRRLFVPDKPSFPPPSESQTLALTVASPSPPRSPSPDPDRDITNSKGLSVDLVRLAGSAAPYSEELRRRTAGMASETELMGFIASLAGKWVSKREKRKFVDASFFGDHLPRGWKLLLGLKRKNHAVWVQCFSYVSPKGSQFTTCKEVSAYLMSLLGYPEAKTVSTQYNSTANPDFCADNGRADDQICCSQHNLSSHEVTAKRCRCGKFGEPVVGRDGKFECPVCHKIFTEESQYFDHIVSHARYQGMTPEEFLNVITSGKVDCNSLAENSLSLQELEHVREAGSQHLSGSNEHGSNNSKVKDHFTAHCFDGFNKPNEAFHRPAEISYITYAPSACNITVPKVNSISNGRPDGSRDGSEVTIHNDQASNHHVFRPNTFGYGNPSSVRIVDHGMASKHGEVNNTVKARDDNLNACLGTSYFPNSSSNNESAGLIEASQSSFTGKYFSGSFSNNGGVCGTSTCSAATSKKGMLLDVANKNPVAASACFSASYGNNIGDGKANLFGYENNTVVYQSNMGMQPVSSMETEVECFTSHSVHPENSDRGLASSTKEQMSNMNNSACNDTRFGTEAYNNNNVRGFAQFSRNITQIKTNNFSHGSLPESNALKASNLTKGTDANIMNGLLVNRSDADCVRDSFVNRHISNNESSVSMYVPKSRDKMQNCNGHASGCVLQAAGGASQNVNGPISTQSSIGSRSSIVRSVDATPMSSTTQDQCDLQLGFGVQKRQIFSGYGELSGSPQAGEPRNNNSVRTGPSQFGSMARPNSFPSGSSQFGSLDRPDAVPTSFQFGIMARPNSEPPSESSQFRSMSSNSVPHEKSTQFGSIARPNCVPPMDAPPFGSMARPNCVLPPGSSQFGSMVRPNSAPHVKSSQFGSTVRPNYMPPANSSQLGSTARSSSFHPAEASEFEKTPRQNFVSRTEPTLVLGYAPQMENGPPIQVGWGMGPPKVTGDMMTCVCIWCNSQFHHFGSADGQQTGSFGFICPACKEKISGHPNMRNNGSWQP